MLGQDMGGFRLTIARWLTPSGRWIHKLGLTPNVVYTAPSSAAPGTDPVLDRAVQLLTGPTAAVAPVSFHVLEMPAAAS